MFCSVCSFEEVDELLVGENRNVFRFTKEDSSSSAKRNINITSEGLPMINAVERAFFSPREDLRRVREKLAGGMALVITVLDSFMSVKSFL